MPKPRVFDAVLVVGLFIAAAFYIVVTFSTNDPAWFWPRFSGEPSTIVLYKGGETVEITAESPDYDSLRQALNRALSQVRGYDESLGLSDDSLLGYRTKEVVLEIFYPEPVVIHSRFSFGRPNTLLIPLAGRHSEENVVFGGINGSYWAGALTLQDLQELKDKLVELGYWQAKP